MNVSEFYIGTNNQIYKQLKKSILGGFNMTHLTRTILNDFDTFDVLFRNLFNTNSHFDTFSENKPNYPIDAYESDNKLKIEIAAIGLNKEDIDISVEGNILKVSDLLKDECKESEKCVSLHRGIARRKFNLAWKVSNKYDLSKLEATLDKGLLRISIPKSKESEAIKIEIK